MLPIDTQWKDRSGLTLFFCRCELGARANMRLTAPCLCLITTLVLAVGLPGCRKKPAEPRVAASVSKAPKWRFKVAEPDPRYVHLVTWQPPAVGDDGTVYEGGSALYAIAPDGSLRWKYGDTQFLAPLIDDTGTLWAGSHMGWMARVDSDSGHGTSIVGGLGDINQIALSPNGSKLFLSGRMMFLVRDRADPLDGPKEDFSSGLQGLAIASDGSTYAVYRTSLLKYGEDHTVKWSQRNLYACGMPSLDNSGDVYLGCPDRATSYAPDGSWRWSFPVDQASAISVASDGTVYFSAGDKNMYALTPDGHKKWQFAGGMSGHSAPAISQAGTIYVGSGDGRFFALNPDGSEKWEFKTNGEVYSPTIAPDGTVYVRSGDGNLYAFANDNGGLAGQWAKLNADLHNTARARSH